MTGASGGGSVESSVRHRGSRGATVQWLRARPMNTRGRRSDGAVSPGSHRQWESWWSTVTVEATSARGAETLPQVVIRFAGDSGDGMQLVGDRFTELSAMFGNDLATLPDFPAEIRAPAGTIAGVSAFQVHISDHDIVTPGDTPNVLVAMNPAALKANLRDLAPGSTLLINADTFEQRNLDKAGYAQNPLNDGSLAAYRVYEIPMTSITVEATKPLGVKPRDAER
jgi:2-oxoglutarate ferredoxin oxidoreductase subunit alpha